MEEEKAAAYYDELTRKGEGAARFKQGLGFSISTENDVAPRAGSALPASSSFLSNFVRASSPSKVSEFEKQAQHQSIQNKLKKKPTSSSTEEVKSSRVSEKSQRESSLRDGDRDSRGQSRSRERHGDRDRNSRKHSQSRGRYKERDRESRRRSRSSERYGDRDSEKRRRRRSGSRSDSDGDRQQRRSLSPRERRSDKRNGSISPHERRRSDSNRSDIGGRRKASKMGREKNVGVDYARLIEGYDKMSPAERVKAKMKLQLSETSEKDLAKGKGWERFEFNKDAPLDDEEVEAAEDDANLVKHIGQSFRFSAVEARREEQIQAAHEEAMFGSSTLPPPTSADSEPERENNEECNKKDLVSSLLSETVLAKQKGSWRDRVRDA